MWEPELEVNNKRMGCGNPNRKFKKQKEGRWEPVSKVNETEERDVGTRIGS